MQYSCRRQQGVNVAGGLTVFAELIVASLLDGRQVPSEVYAGILHNAAGFQAQLHDHLDPVGLGRVVIHVATMLARTMKSISSFKAQSY
jgi:hypothetical protein